MEDPKNFLQAPGVIMLICNVDGKLKVWYFLDAAPKALPTIKMAQIVRNFLKNVKILYRKDPGVTPSFTI